jgi:hypothetical protein
MSSLDPVSGPKGNEGERVLRTGLDAEPTGMTRLRADDDGSDLARLATAHSKSSYSLTKWSAGLK